MREVRATTGPFPIRPYYEAGDIERICEDELRRVGLFPDRPEPVRIDRFIEKRFRLIPETCDLPQGVLGYTSFNDRGVKTIVIAASLETGDTDANRRRARTTFAHEAGHGLLHAHLFALPTGVQQTIHGTAEAPEPYLCRDEHVGAYDGRWWEYQANQAMAALLLPQRLVQTAVDSFLTPEGLLGLSTLQEPQREPAARHLSTIFDVNPVVARRRLETLFPTTAQTTL